VCQKNFLLHLLIIPYATNFFVTQFSVLYPALFCGVPQLRGLCEQKRAIAAAQSPAYAYLFSAVPDNFLPILPMHCIFHNNNLDNLQENH
jgi:hypothetical protein